MTSTITTHVLDTTAGLPARGMTVELADADGAVLATSTTNDDGRVVDLGPDDLRPGTYRVRFETGAWFENRGAAAFYPEVTLTVVLEPGRRHLHVPILLSPFAYSTYRGS